MRNGEASLEVASPYLALAARPSIQNGRNYLANGSQSKGRAKSSYSAGRH